MFLIKEFGHLQIQLQDIVSATDNFSSSKLVGHGGFGQVYKGELTLPEGQSTVAFKRLDRKFGQGNTEFWKEIMMLSKCKHENLISLTHFCSEGTEMILVYEYASRGSLDRYLSDASLTWMQRLKICVGVARGLSYLHDPMETKERVLHRDIKSSNILIDEQWNAKVSDFGLSKVGPANQAQTFLVTNVVGTFGYCDPSYHETGVLTKESDVYSFGVVLFEVMCGRLCCEYHNGQLQLFLVPVWKQCIHKKRVDDIIFNDLKGQIDDDCLKTFSTIAYQCLHKDHKKRPTMIQVMKELEVALRQQTGENHEETAITIPRPPKTARETMLQLRFQANLPNTFFTGDRIQSEDGSVVKVMLFDIRFNNWVISGPMTSLSIEIVPLDGDFSANDDEDWPEKHFRSKVIRPRSGRKPLMNGNLVTLENGIGCLSDLRITDNSKWLRGGKFMIGARTRGDVGGRIREAISQVFVVRDHRQKAAGPPPEAEVAEEAVEKLVHFEGTVGFTKDDLLSATAEIIGKSTYGTVYKATLEEGDEMAVKRLREKITKNQKEFEIEVNLLGKIRHPNLLAMRAYYLGPKQEKLLVFDYMPKGSLAAFLHARGPETGVDWPTRMQIMRGMARGLLSLHGHHNIIHGNITSSNVLLDENMNPEIADFGLSRLMTTAANSNMIATAEALGYRAPELSKLKKADAKTDVYSLGVIMLELLTGKSPKDGMNGVDLPQWAASILKEERASEIFDLELKDVGDELLNTLKLALHCVDPSPSARPEVELVLQQLEEVRPQTSTSDGDRVFEQKKLGGIQIKTKPTRFTEYLSSEHSSSSGTKSSNVVARLMGLDILPKYSSPRPHVSPRRWR